jgi:hypothetical protein
MVDVLDWCAIWPPRGGFFAAKALALIPVECQQFPKRHRIND